VKCYFSAKLTETCQINNPFYQNNKFVVKLTIISHNQIQLSEDRIIIKYKPMDREEESYSVSGIYSCVVNIASYS